MSKYEELKNRQRVCAEMRFNLLVEGSNEQIDSEIGKKIMRDDTDASECVKSYERKSAEMHEELVELLSSIPCHKCGLFTACGMSTKIDAIYDALKRAKAL